MNGRTYAMVAKLHQRRTPGGPAQRALAITNHPSVRAPLHMASPRMEALSSTLQDLLILHVSLGAGVTKKIPLFVRRQRRVGKCKLARLSIHIPSTPSSREEPWAPRITNASGLQGLRPETKGSPTSSFQLCRRFLLPVQISA